MAQNNTIEKKVKMMFLLMEKLVQGDELCPKDKGLQEELDGVSERTLERYLKDIVALYGHVVFTEKLEREYALRKVIVYKATTNGKDKREILKFFLNNSNDLGFLLQSVHENDPTILDDAENSELLYESLKKDEDIFLFKNNPFEKFEGNHQQKLFTTVKSGIKARKYFNIEYKQDDKIIFFNEAKVLKLVYMNNNWYLAIVSEDEELKLIRFSFILRVSPGWKNSYTKKSVKQYKEYFEKLQNPFTLNKPFKTAKIEASAHVAKYFKEGMKPFFPSQEFIIENDNGTIEFSVDYTQTMEILPFIKNWSPDLKVLEPDTLITAIKKSLEASLKHYI